MPDQVDVSIVSDWGFLEPSGVAHACLIVRLHGVPPENNTEPLGEAPTAKFFKRFEERFTPQILERLRTIQPDIKVSVSCFAAKKGSFEFIVIILAGVTAEGVRKFVVDYPKFKQGLAEIAADIKKSGKWLMETAASSFDWITGRSAKKDDPPAVTASPTDEEDSKTAEARAKRLKHLKDRAPKKKPFK